MTSWSARLAIAGCALVLVGGASCGGSGPALAAEQLTEAQILEALKPKRTTRSMAAPSAEEQRKAQEDRAFIESLRQRNRTVTVADSEETNTIAGETPDIDLDITFDPGSATIGPDARELLLMIGKVLHDPQLKGATFVLAGHADGREGELNGLDLSNRRAEAVKRFLIETLGVPANSLVAVGYGKERLKNPTDPVAEENRRVELVNKERQPEADTK